MAIDGGLHLTSEKLRQWMDRKTELESQITQNRQELATINQRLEAVAILSQSSDSEGVSGKDAKPTLPPDESMVDAVERIVFQAGGPVARAQLKKALAEAGYPKSRMGNYFYTLIARLKERERIVVASDGRVSAGPKSRAGSNGGAG